MDRWLAIVVGALWIGVAVYYLRDALGTWAIMRQHWRKR